MKYFLSLLIVGSLSQQLMPIPSPTDGFYMGPVSSNYTLEVFIDHFCPDSAASFPGLYQYWQSNQAWLGLNIHIFPLAWHKYSFIAAQGGRYVQQTNPSKFISFVNWMFANQNLYLNFYTTWDFATAQIKVAGYVNQATNLPLIGIQNALNNATINWSSRVSWKYAGSRDLTGAPLFLLNDVWVPSLTGFTTPAQWDAFFKSL